MFTKVDMEQNEGVRYLRIDCLLPLLQGEAIVVPTTATLFQRVSRTHTTLLRSVLKTISIGAIRRSIILPPNLMTTAAIPNALRRLRDRPSPNKPTVEVVYTSQPEWPLRSITEPPKCLRLSILDSSFNPPTLAHAALARLGPQNKTENPGSILLPSSSYDAHLLLLSVTNADKILKPGDAGLEQRLEMIHLLAKDIQSLDTSHSASNIAVAAIDEPTFVGKARQLREFLLTKISEVLTVDGDGGNNAVPLPSLQLHFILGFDTVVRLFSTRFYASQDTMRSLLKTFFDPTGDNCVVVCARRGLKEGSSQEERDAEEREFAEGIEVRTYIEAGRVVLVDIPEDLQVISSTKVRKGRWDFVPSSIRAYIEEKELYTPI